MLSIKKYILAALLLLSFPFTTFAFSADYDPGIWAFVFHLEIKDGILRAQADAVIPYEATPVSETPDSKDPNESDFHVDIIGVRGNMLGSFGFDDPKTVVPALGKSVFDVYTPFFANGTRALISTKEGKKLLELSLSGTSFCNDNAVCDTDVGENFVNCANDCPAPEVLTPIPQTNDGDVGETPTQEVGGEKPVITSTDGTATITRTQGDTEKRSSVIPMTIGVGIILLALVGLIYWRRRGIE
jgi:hypothetical protein